MLLILWSDFLQIIMQFQLNFLLLFVKFLPQENLSNNVDQILPSSLKTKTKEVISPGQNSKKLPLSDMQNKNDVGAEIAEKEPELSKNQRKQAFHQAVLNSHKMRVEYKAEYRQKEFERILAKMQKKSKAGDKPLTSTVSEPSVRPNDWNKCNHFLKPNIFHICLLILSLFCISSCKTR